jgi:hypothetical protein
MPYFSPRILLELHEAGEIHLLTSCPNCGREGTYYVKRLLEAYGNLELPVLLRGLTFGCEKRIAARPNDLCENRFVGAARVDVEEILHAGRLAD